MKGREKVRDNHKIKQNMFFSWSWWFFMVNLCISVLINLCFTYVLMLLIMPLKPGISPPLNHPCLTSICLHNLHPDPTAPLPTHCFISVSHPIARVCKLHQGPAAVQPDSFAGMWNRSLQPNLWAGHSGKHRAGESQRQH